MSQLVRAQDGTLHVFPDGVSPEQIAGALGVARGPTKAEVIEASAQATGLNPRVLQGLVHVESGGNSHASGVDPKTGKHTGALGITQIGPELRKEYGITDPADYTQTIPATAKILQARLASNGGDITDALKFYHGGPNQKIWGPLTNAYPGQVLGAGGLEAKDAMQALPTVSPQAAQDQAMLHGTSEAQAAPPTNWWGPLAEAANSVTLGQGNKILGAADRLMGHGDTADAQQANADAARQAYVKAHPLAAAGIDIAGSTPATMYGLALGGQGLAPLANTARSLGPLAESGVNFLTGNLGNFGRGTQQALTAMGSLASRGAIEGTGAGVLQSGLNPQSTGEQAKMGALVGAVANPLLGAGVNAVLPLGAQINPMVARLGNKLADLGVDLRGGQLAASPEVQKLDKGLFGQDNTPVLKQWTKAALKTLGADSDEANPQVMHEAKEAISKKFDSVKGVPEVVPFNTPVPAFASEANPGGNTLQETLDDLHTKLQGLPLDEGTLKQAEKLHNTVAKAGITGDGALSGDEYLALTKTGGPVQTLMRSGDSNLRFYGAQVRNALDTALEHGAASTGNASLLSTIKTARGQYKNMLALEPLVEKAQATGGLLDPTLLQSRVGKMFSDYGFSPDSGGDLGTLGEGGKILPRPTAQGEAKASVAPGMVSNMLHNPLVSGIGGGLAALGAAHEAVPAVSAISHHPLAGAILTGTAALGLGAKGGTHAVRRAVMASPEFRNLLIQNALNPESRRVGNNLLLPALTQGVNSQ